MLNWFSLLNNMHWLPITYRIQFKVVILAYMALYSMAPIYLLYLLHIKSLRSKLTFMFFSERNLPG